MFTFVLSMFFFLRPTFPFCRVVYLRQKKNKCHTFKTSFGWSKLTGVIPCMSVFAYTPLKATCCQHRLELIVFFHVFIANKIFLDEGAPPNGCLCCLRLAERRKDEGNEQYKAKEYREALKLYTQAIGEYQGFFFF